MDVLFLTLGYSIPTITNSCSQPYIQNNLAKCILKSRSCILMIFYFFQKKVKMFVSPNSYVEIPMPKQDVLGDGTSGEFWSLGWSLDEWDQCSCKRGPREIPCPYHREKGLSMHQEVAPYPHDRAGALRSDSQPPEL